MKYLEYCSEQSQEIQESFSVRHRSSEKKKISYVPLTRNSSERDLFKFFFNGAINTLVWKQRESGKKNLNFKFEILRSAVKELQAQNICAIGCAATLLIGIGQFF